MNDVFEQLNSMRVLEQFRELLAEEPSMRPDLIPALHTYRLDMGDQWLEVRARDPRSALDEAFEQLPELNWMNEGEIKWRRM